MLPPALQELVQFFEHLTEQERRENLTTLAAQSVRHEPRENEQFDFQDVRRDAECTDTVGVFLRVVDNQRVHLAISLGPAVQTLTRAMAVVLCRGLEGATVREIQALPQDFVSRIAGADLMRQRSRTVYYVLRRIQEAVAKISACH